MPQPPKLETHPSTGSGSTMYSQRLGDDPPPLSMMYDMSQTATGASENTLLPRDSAGNVLHPGAIDSGKPGLTWAANPDHGRTATKLPGLFYGNGQSGVGLRQGTQQNQHNQGFSDSADIIRRKKSLVRPERERLNPDYRHLNYMQHAAVFEAENPGRIGYTATGHGNHLQTLGMPYGGGQGGISAVGLAPGVDGRPNLRRGKSVLAREEGMANESGLNFLKRGATLRRKRIRDQDSPANGELTNHKSRQQGTEKAPLGAWMIYCYIVTCLLPGIFLKKMGRHHCALSLKAKF